MSFMDAPITKDINPFALFPDHREISQSIQEEMMLVLKFSEIIDLLISL